jgi:hypothetical protein
MAEQSPLSQVFQRKKSGCGKNSAVATSGNSSDSSPVFRRKFRQPAADMQDTNTGNVSRIKPLSKKVSLRQSFVKNPMFDLQAKEDRGGVSVSGSENSSDDGWKSDMSYVSPTHGHANAEKHVYLTSFCSQGGFPTPMHKRRQADSMYMSIAGANTCHVYND